MKVDQIKKANTKYIGKNIIYYKQIDSTHIKAKELVEKQIENGTIIIAEEQTAGIGTKARVWYTGNENIAMTIVIYPDCKLEKLNGFTLKIGEIMKETISELYQIQLEIKEPNDLMLDGKKISGILTQTATKEGKIQYLIISIGFNVNEEKFSREIENTATSLKKQYGKNFKREEIIMHFIEKLEIEINEIMKI